MFKTFKLFVEEREQDRTMQAMLLKRLGFEPKAMDVTTIKLRDLSKDRLKQAIGSMGMDPDTVQTLTNWVENNPDTTLQNLLAQVSGQPRVSDDPGQSDMPNQPAELPQGQPKPERRPMPPMYGGGPPVDARLS
jgi:hypothetical protein